MLIEKFDDMNERLKGEFAYLQKKYPKVAFNVLNDPSHNKDYLFATLGYTNWPQNYNLNIISKYKGFLTCNGKFYEKYKDKFNIYHTNGPIDTHNYYMLDRINSYDERINGICVLNRVYTNPGSPGDILYLREQIANTFPVCPTMVFHTYGPIPWGKDYQGNPSVTDVTINHPNHTGNLEIQQKYHFVLCLETMYHGFWSWDRVTERLWNAFKTKTVPIYYGCYNIEQKVPKDLFIDYRDFSNLQELSDYLVSFPEQRWVDMTEKAFEWYKTCKIGDIETLEGILSSLP